MLSDLFNFLTSLFAVIQGQKLRKGSDFYKVEYKVCEINKKKVDEIEMRLDEKYTGKINFITIF